MKNDSSGEIPTCRYVQTHLAWGEVKREKDHLLIFTMDELL